MWIARTVYSPTHQYVCVYWHCYHCSYSGGVFDLFVTKFMWRTEQALKKTLAIELYGSYKSWEACLKSGPNLNREEGKGYLVIEKCLGLLSLHSFLYRVFSYPQSDTTEIVWFILYVWRYQMDYQFTLEQIRKMSICTCTLCMDVCSFHVHTRRGCTVNWRCV